MSIQSMVFPNKNENLFMIGDSLSIRSGTFCTPHRFQKDSLMGKEERMQST
jgi:hypothetical protein